MRTSLLRHNNSRGKQQWRLAVTARMWRTVVDCSTHEPWQWSLTVNNRVQRMTSDDNEVEHSRRYVSNSPGSRSSSARYDNAATRQHCRQVDQACSQSSPPPSTNEVHKRVVWRGHASMTRIPGVHQRLLTLELVQWIPARIAFLWSNSDEMSDVTSDWKMDLAIVELCAHAEHHKLSTSIHTSKTMARFILLCRSRHKIAGVKKVLS